MTVDPAALSELRLQLDAIDTQLHDLLMRRGELAHRIAIAKGSAAAIMRPEREAQIVRRLAKRHLGPFPFGAVARIWREIISAMTALQGKFAIAVQHPDPGGYGLWETARDHFGAIATYTSHSAAIAVLRAVADGAATAGVLPRPHEGESDAWWPSLLNVSPGSLQVIARLPFLQNAADLTRDALVIGRSSAGPSGYDRSLLILETQEQTSRARLLARLTGAGFDVMFITGQAGGETDEYRHLIEVAGYIDAVDTRCRTLMEANPGEFTLILPIGGYAVPLDLAGEASTPQTD